MIGLWAYSNSCTFGHAEKRCLQNVTLPFGGEAGIVPTVAIDVVYGPTIEAGAIEAINEARDKTVLGDSTHNIVLLNSVGKDVASGEDVDIHGCKKVVERRAQRVVVQGVANVVQNMKKVFVLLAIYACNLGIDKRRQFNHTHCGNISSRVQDKMAELEGIRLDILGSSSSGEFLENEKRVQKELFDLLVADESFYKQKSRVTWIQERDHNTKFFQTLVAAKKAIYFQYCF
ncbi:hypothetical protein V6N13_109821 [Hibiscus sabdariffa]